MENQNSEEREKRIDEVYEQLRLEEVAKRQEKPQKRTGEFKTLPDGTYIGRIYIKANTVGNEKSPNYGLKKYQFEFTVTEGEYKGNMAYFHHVIVEHELAAPPPKSDEAKSKIWSAAVRLSVEKANARLTLCGVDCSDFNQALIIQRIAENNRRNTIVNFSMNNGSPFVNYIVTPKVEDREDSLFRAITAPDGNDAPLV